MAESECSRPSEAAEKRCRAAVALLTAVFLLRGLFLIAALPIGDPLDEPYHFAYADFLSETGRIPRERENSMPVEMGRITALLPRSTRVGGPRVEWSRFAAMPATERAARRREALAYRPEERGVYAGPNYETQQPPLTYMMGAAVLRAVPRSTLAVRLFALRTLSVALASCAVPLAFIFFRRLFCRDAAIAATLAFVAYPGPATFTARFTNDALAFPIAAALLILLTDAAGGALTRRKAVLLAALLALGAWTKLYFLPLFAAPPLAAALGPVSTRWPAVRRGAAAGLVALLLVSPWLIHQYIDTGDWLGLVATKMAGRSGASVLGVARAALPAISPTYAGAFVRSNIFPGAWAVIGAPRVPAVLAIAGFLVMVGAGVVAGPLARPSARRLWWGSAIAVALFVAAQVMHDATLAAAFGWRISATEGWYLLVLLPVTIALPAAFGRTVSPRMVIGAAALFVFADMTCTFGVLPAAYAGVAQLGARTPFSSYSDFLFAPSAALASYARVSLSGWSAAVLGILAVAWMAVLAGALAVAHRSRS